MKYKKFKYKNYSAKPSKKRAWIIGISIAVAVLLIAAAIIVVVLLNNGSDNNGNNSNVGNNGSNIGEMPGHTEEEDPIVRLTILNKPDKISYYCNEAFEKAGLEVYSWRKSGLPIQVNLDDCTITGFDSSVPVNAQTITVTYKEFTATFTVEIKEAPKPVENVLESIAFVTLPKTQYKVGEWPETDGGVLVCTYTDGTTKNIDLDPSYVYGFSYALNAGVGEYDITVKYTENGVQATTTYKITISE